jgi:hypothetical protein
MSSGGRFLTVAEQADLLRSHGYVPPVALNQVGNPDEACDEVGLRPLVDLKRRADLLDPAAVQHRDPVAHR